MTEDDTVDIGGMILTPDGVLFYRRPYESEAEARERHLMSSAVPTLLPYLAS